jgi:phospholipase C
MALQQLGIGVAALTVGCTAGATDVPPPGPAVDGPPDLSSAPPPTPDLGSAPDLSPLSPGQLLAGIDAVVVLMMENRSFDHFLGSLARDASYPGRALVDGLTGSESNPDPAGQPVALHQLMNFTPADPPHSWDASHQQWNDGKNDGFVIAHAGASQADVMGYHDRSQLPFLYALADRYTTCDRWYASVMGPTWPNRFYLHSCTSVGKRDNKPFLGAGPDTVWDRLKAKGLVGKNFTPGLIPFYTGGYVGKLLQMNPAAKFDEFLRDAKAGTLPPFSMIDPDFLTNDDHPSHNIQLGQAFLATVVAALAQSPQWSRTLLMITYDEHGGFFDHVSPPHVVDDQPGFYQLGFRVPGLVIGPTVRAGHVERTQYDHTSVAATLRTRFGIASLSPRMDAAADVSACIDPRRIGNPAPPPTDLPKVSLRLRDALRFSGVHSQPELLTLIQSGAIPAHLVDQRSDAERTLSWLRAGEQLGALRLDG